MRSHNKQFMAEISLRATLESE